MTILRAYAYKIDTHTTDSAFKKLPFVFPQEQIPTVDVCRTRLRFLSGIKPERYHCCVNSCCCFVGPHSNCEECPYCGEGRYLQGHDGKKKARKYFNYLPFIPRLIAMYANTRKAQEMRYRGFEHEHVPGKIKDIFDGHVYQHLLGKKVIIDDEEASHTYFSSPRDIALGLSTDGFAPFKHRKSTAWPLILFNYNLPPETRFQKGNIIGLGAIPGHKKPLDADSFAWPALVEFLRLQIGVRAFDVEADEFFLLRAYLILVFGDIPAMSMLMRMKGHNGFSPCRMCKILGVRVPGAQGSTHYVPLDRSAHPSILESEDADALAIAKYDPANLPLRTEAEMLQQAQMVQGAPSDAEATRRSKAFGIKGVPALSYLKSLSFPLSFPYDFMHLIWENTIPNLILLWTGEFKGLDEGVEDYQFSPKVWEAIGTATAAAGSTIPSAFCTRPPNIVINKSACTAESWSFWALFIGPVLLRRRFSHGKYYQHFIKLVTLLNICLQFEITTDEVETLREGFIKWVEEYEKCVFFLY
jgi:Transposase family tnp2